MVTTIWKFPLEVTDRVTLPMPVGATVLSVGVHGRVRRVNKPSG